MRSVLVRTYSTNYFQRLTLESWSLSICQQVPVPYKRLIHAVNETDKQNSNRLTDQAMVDDKLNTSLAANTIKAKLTNHF